MRAITMSTKKTEQDSTQVMLVLRKWVQNEYENR